MEGNLSQLDGRPPPIVTCRPQGVRRGKQLGVAANFLAVCACVHRCQLPQRLHVMSCLPTSIVSLVGAGGGTFARGHLRQRKVSRGDGPRLAWPLFVVTKSLSLRGTMHCACPPIYGNLATEICGTSFVMDISQFSRQEICTTVVEKICLGDSRGGTMCCLLPTSGER